MNTDNVQVHTAKAIEISNTVGPIEAWEYLWGRNARNETTFEEHCACADALIAHQDAQ